MTDSWTNRIELSELRIGDHIYRFSNLHSDVHHGIYVGVDQVIHYKCRRSGKTRNRGMCKKCGHERARRGVVKSCLACFLRGHQLYRFKYNVSTSYYLAKNKGTCFPGPCNEPEIVIWRACVVLNNNNHSDTATEAVYTLFDEHAECFGVFCMTGSGKSAQEVAQKISKVKAVEKVGVLLKIGHDLMTGNMLGMVWKSGKELVKLGVNALTGNDEISDAIWHRWCPALQDVSSSNSLTIPRKNY